MDGFLTNIHLQFFSSSARCHFWPLWLQQSRSVYNIDGGGTAATLYLFIIPSARGCRFSFEINPVTMDCKTALYSFPTFVTQLAESFATHESFFRIFLVESIFRMFPNIDVIQAFKTSLLHQTSLVWTDNHHIDVGRIFAGSALL